MVYQSLQSTFKHPLVQSFALATVVGIVTGIIGPYGRYLSGMPIERISFWVVCLWIGWAVFAWTVPPLTRWTRRKNVWPRLWVLPTLLLLSVVPAYLSRLLSLHIWPMAEQVSASNWFGQCAVIYGFIFVGISWMTRS